MSVACMWYIDAAAALPAGAPTATAAVSQIQWTSQPALPPLPVQPAGRAYWAFVNRGRTIDARKIDNVTALATEQDKDGGGSGGKGDEADDAASFQLRDDLTADNVGNFTYYELLGFDKYGTGVTDDGLKKAYRKAVLKYHPDKVGASVADEGEEDEVFILMQKAYETLTDVTKKRAYDSSLEFDDTIPADDAGKNGDFFEVYGPVFSRNERFAVVVPAPPLGGDDAPIEEVNKFYEYWANFESWRDFTLDSAEHNLDDAEDRYHKRWMEKENAKRSKDLKKKEYKRLSRLVDNAYAADPRVKRARQAEADAKRAKKEAREAEKRAKEEAAAKEVADARAAAAATEAEAAARAKDAKVAREAAKKEARRLKKILRAGFAAALAAESAAAAATANGNGDAGDHEHEHVHDPDHLVEADLEFFCDYGTGEQLAAGAAALKEDGSGGTAAIAPIIKAVKGEQAAAAAAMEKIKAADAARRAADARRVAETKRAAKAARVWSDAEVSALSKGAAKFPAGTQSRWTKVAEFVAAATHAAAPRSKDECIAKYQEIAAMPVKAHKPIAAEPAAAPAEAPLPVPPATAAAAVTPVAAAVTAVAEEPARAARAPSGSGGGGAAAADAPEDVWTDEQHRAFVAAIAKFPPAMEKNERWNAIAAAVPGKSRKQCVDRFKFVKARLMAKKQAAGDAK